MYILDFAYTYVYDNGAYRNKVMWVRDMENLKVDYVVLGSSRVFYHVDPIQIRASTGKQGLNLGDNAFSSFESYLLLKEFLKTNRTENVYVQVDNLFKDDGPHHVGEKSWIPFINEKSIYRDFSIYGFEYELYKSIPFYRFQKFESRIGYRDVVTSALGKGHDYEPLLGYHPVSKVLQRNLKPRKSIESDKLNRSIKAIIELCNDQNIKLAFFTAPIYNYDGDLRVFKSCFQNIQIFMTVSVEKRILATKYI